MNSRKTIAGMPATEYWRKNWRDNKPKILKRRRERYAKDKDYREKTKAKQRENYRRSGRKRERDDLGAIRVHSVTYNGVTIETRLLTVHQMASYLGVSVNTIRNWVKYGKIFKPYYKSGSDWRLFTVYEAELISRHIERFVRVKKRKLAMPISVLVKITEEHTKTFVKGVPKKMFQVAN